MEKEVGIKSERSDVSTPDHTDVSSFDYNRLYGELYRKLLTTPVQDIFHPTASLTPSPAIPPIMPRTSHVTSASNAGDIQNYRECSSPKISGIVHPAFPFPAQSMYPETTSGQQSFQDSLNNMIFGTTPTKSPRVKSESKGLASKGDCSPQPVDLQSADMMYTNGIQGDMDVGALVEEFRVTLEKYGVSQRFAARYIMQDTSQGNLSFLIEKGRNKSWQELSPRGRVPYLKMKSWLESKDQQMWTLEMLKQSQEMKKVGPRDAYNRRERFSMFQLTVLCRLFEENSNPPMDVRNAVAERLNIPLDRVNVWFQNQRARGFPAKKMLQQSTFNENQSLPKMKVGRGPTVDSSPLGRRNSTVGDSFQGQEVKSEFSKWQSPVIDRKLVQPVFPDLRNRIPLEHKHIQPSELPFDQSAKPLDLSSGKQVSNECANMVLSVEMSPTEKVNGYLDHIDRVHSGTDISQVNTTPVQSSQKQTGAAKRKRGNVYKHVSPHAQTTEHYSSALPKTPITVGDECDVDNCSKTDQSSKRAKCDTTYAEESDSEFIGNTHNRNDVNEPKYSVIQNGYESPSNSENAETKSDNQTNDILDEPTQGVVRCHGDEGKQSLEKSGTKSPGDNGSVISTKAICENDVNAKVSELVKVFEEGEHVSPETVGLFKSFCANLLMKNKTNNHSDETGSN